MQAKVFAVLSNPIYWLIFGLVIKELLSLLTKGELMGVQWLTKDGNAPAADLLAIVGDGAQGLLSAISAGKSPEEALANAKAAVLTTYAQQQGRALKDIEAEVGYLIETKLRLRSGHPQLQVTAPGGATVNLPKPGGFFVPWQVLGVLLVLPIVALPFIFLRAVCVFRGHIYARRECTRCGKVKSMPKLLAIALLACLATTATARAQTPPAAPAAPHASLTLQATDWRTIVFNHGPSIPLIEIDPKNPHPIQVAAGAGYSAGACFGQTTINGASLSWICLSVEAFASIISPEGVAEGGVQVAPVLGLLSNALVAGPLFTPWTANGNGFLQLGRPGTDWVFSANPVTLWHILGGM